MSAQALPAGAVPQRLGAATLPAAAAYDAYDSNLVEVYIPRLRRKLGDLKPRTSTTPGVLSPIRDSGSLAASSAAAGSNWVAALEW